MEPANLNKCLIPKWVVRLNLICVFAIVVVWFGVDMNGSFFGLGEVKTTIIVLLLAIFGFIFNARWFYSQPKARVIATLIGAVYVFSLFEVFRYLMAQLY